MIGTVDKLSRLSPVVSVLVSAVSGMAITNVVTAARATLPSVSHPSLRVPPKSGRGD